jgi:hypothetical protein
VPLEEGAGQLGVRVAVRRVDVDLPAVDDQLVATASGQCERGEAVLGRGLGQEGEWWRAGSAPLAVYGLDLPIRRSSGTVRRITAGALPKSVANWSAIRAARLVVLFEDAVKSTFPVWMYVETSVYPSESNDRTSSAMAMRP